MEEEILFGSPNKVNAVPSVRIALKDMQPPIRQK